MCRASPSAGVFSCDIASQVSRKTPFSVCRLFSRSAIAAAHPAPTASVDDQASSYGSLSTFPGYRWGAPLATPRRGGGHSVATQRRPRERRLTLTLPPAVVEDIVAGMCRTGHSGPGRWLPPRGLTGVERQSSVTHLMFAWPLGVSTISQLPTVDFVVWATGVPDTRLVWHVRMKSPVGVTTLVPDPSYMLAPRNTSQGTRLFTSASALPVAGRTSATAPATRAASIEHLTTTCLPMTTSPLERYGRAIIEQRSVSVNR
jgi:hypothetical protein